MRYSYGVAFLGALAYSTTVVGLPLDFGDDDLAVRDVNEALELDARMVDDFDVDAREIDFDVDARDVDFEEVYGRNLGGTPPPPGTLSDPGLGGGFGGDLGGGVVGGAGAGPVPRPGTVRTEVAGVLMGGSKTDAVSNVVAGARQRVGNRVGQSVTRRIGGIQRAQTWGRRDFGFEEFDRRQPPPGLDPMMGGAPGGMPADPMSGGSMAPMGDPMGGSMGPDPTMGMGGGGYSGKPKQKKRTRVKNWFKSKFGKKSAPAPGYYRRNLQDQVTSGAAGSQGPSGSLSTKPSLNDPINGLSSPPPGQGLSSPPPGQGLSSPPPGHGNGLPPANGLPSGGSPPASPVLGATQPGQGQSLGQDHTGVKRKRTRGNNKRSKKRKLSLSVPAQPLHGGNGGSTLPNNPPLGTGSSPSLPNSPPLQQFRRSSWFLDELD